MTIYPAIDLYEGKAVRLQRGDYEQMTVYSDAPLFVALGFKNKGATALHMVDLEGARDGKPANFETIEKIAYETENKLLKKVSLFDVYQGKNLEAGKKSYAVSFILQDESKTLTDSQIDDIMNKIMRNLATRIGAKIR